METLPETDFTDPDDRARLCPECQKTKQSIPLKLTVSTAQPTPKGIFIIDTLVCPTCKSQFTRQRPVPQLEDAS